MALKIAKSVYKLEQDWRVLRYKDQPAFCLDDLQKWFDIPLDAKEIWVTISAEPLPESYKVTSDTIFSRVEIADSLEQSHYVSTYTWAARVLYEWLQTTKRPLAYVSFQYTV